MEPPSVITGINDYRIKLVPFSRGGLFKTLTQLAISVLFLANIDGVISFLARIHPAVQKNVETSNFATFILIVLIIWLFLVLLVKLIIPIFRLFSGYKDLLNYVDGSQNTTNAILKRNRALQQAKDKISLVNYFQAFTLLENSLLAFLNEKKWGSMQVMATFLDSESAELICEIDMGSEDNISPGIILEVFEEPGVKSCGGISIQRVLNNKSFGQIIYRDNNPDFWSNLETLSLSQKNSKIPAHSLVPLIPEYFRSLNDEEIESLRKLISEVKIAFSKTVITQEGNSII